GLAVVVAEARGAGHLAHDEQEDVVLEAALKEVLDHCRDDLVQDREADLHLLENVPDAGVVVPAERLLARDTGEVDGDDADTGLDQPASEEAALADGVPAVAVADPVVFLVESEGMGRLLAGEQGERLLLVGFEGRRGTGSIDGAADGVEAVQKASAAS